MNSTTALVPSKDGLAADSLTWAERAKGMQIEDRDSYVNAGQLLTSVKYFRQQIAEWFSPHVEAAMETKRKAEAARKALVDEQHRMEAPLVDAEAFLKRALLAWDAKQEDIRREEERQLQADAQRRAEAATLAAAAALELEAHATGDEAMLQEAHDILEQPIDAPAVFVKTAGAKSARGELQGQLEGP